MIKLDLRTWTERTPVPQELILNIISIYMVKQP